MTASGSFTASYSMRTSREGRSHGFHLGSTFLLNTADAATHKTSPLLRSRGHLRGRIGWAKVTAARASEPAIIDTVRPIASIHLRLKLAALEQPIDHDLNAMLYVFGGDLHVEQRRVEDGRLARMPGLVNLVAGDAGELGGRTELDEPVPYGPFDNTEEETSKPSKTTRWTVGLTLRWTHCTEPRLGREIGEALYRICQYFAMNQTVQHEAPHRLRV